MKKLVNDNLSLIGVALELIKRAIRFVYDRRTIRG